MSLQAPVAVAQGRRFGDSQTYDYAYWHRSDEDAMFGWYSGASKGLFHAGLDFPAPDGTAIVAPEASIIEAASWAPLGSAFDGGGLGVQGRIAGGMHWRSNHMSAEQVSVGQKVAKGQKVGAVGHTGHAFGAHDHFVLFTIQASGAYLFRNPAHYLPGGKYATSPLIAPSTGGGEFMASVGPGTVTAFGVSKGVIVNHKSQTFARSSSAGEVTQGIPGYYLVHAGVFAGMYLIVDKSGPFSVRRI